MVNFEDSDLNKQSLQFITDPTSGFDKDISIDGWNILNVTVRSVAKEYDTNFGDTSKPSVDEYSRVVMDIELEMTVTGFIQLSLEVRIQVIRS